MSTTTQFDATQPRATGIARARKPLLTNATRRRGCRGLGVNVVCLFGVLCLTSQAAAQVTTDPLSWSDGEGFLLEAPIRPLNDPVASELPAPEGAKAPNAGDQAAMSASEEIGSGASNASTNAVPMDALSLPAEAVEQPPLQQEVVRWYQYPARWMKGWDSHAELGLDGSDGNADTLAFQTGMEMKRKTDRDQWFLDIDYRRVTSRGVTTEDNGRFNLDYDRLLGDSRYSAFGKLGMEFDSFKAFDSRLNLNGGLGYHWIKTESTSLITRFGAGASREFGGPNEDWTPEAVFGIEAERQLTERQKLKGKLDYFPAWEDFGNYRLVFDGAWEILLDGSENLSLRLAVTDRYDSTPEGRLPNDVYYSLLLLYKF